MSNDTDRVVEYPTVEDWWGSVQYSLLKANLILIAAKHGRNIPDITPELAVAMRHAFEAGKRQSGSASNGLSPKEKMAADTGPLTVAALIAADDSPVGRSRADDVIEAAQRLSDVLFKIEGVPASVRDANGRLESALGLYKMDVTPKRHIPAEAEARLMGWVAEDDDTDVTTWLSSDYTVSQAKEDVHALLYGVEPKVGDQP